MKKIPLRCIDRQFHNQMFHLVLDEEMATLKDQHGKDVESFTLEQAVERIEPPSFTKSITHLTIDSKVGVLKFNSRKEDMEILTRFLEQTVTRKGPDTIRNYRVLMIAGIAVGLVLALIGLYFSVSSVNKAVVSPQNPKGEYTIYYGPVVIGLVIIGQCAYLLGRSLSMRPGGLKEEDDGRKALAPQVVTGAILGGAGVILIAAYFAFNAMTAPPTNPNTAGGPTQPKPLNVHAAIPSGFACNIELAPRGDGLEVPHGKYILSNDAGFLEKDFDLDVVFEATDSQKYVSIGIGPGATQDYPEPVDSVMARSNAKGDYNGSVVITNKSDDSLDSLVRNVPTNGPHLMRFSKRGMNVTWAIHLDYTGGEFKPTQSITYHDVRTVQPKLTRENSRLFYGGRGVFTKASLTVIGPSTPATHPALPEGFEAEKAVRVVDGALVPRSYIRTIDDTFMQKDFDLDVVFKCDGVNTNPVYIGVGTKRDGLGQAYAQLILRINPYRAREDPVVLAKSIHESPSSSFKIGNMMNWPGTHMARFSKRGMAITCSIDENYDGNFNPTITNTAPDLTKIDAQIASQKTHLFFGHGTFTNVKLTIVPK